MSHHRYRLKRNRRQAVMYGSECWPLNKNEKVEMKVVEMKMIGLMCSAIRSDGIRIDYIEEL